MLPHEVFYPIHWWDSRFYYTREWEGAAAALKPGVTVGVHLWNKVYSNASGYYNGSHASRPWLRDSFATRFVREQCGGWAPGD